jgi:hypothetical protein
VVEDPGTSRNNMYENREASRVPAEQAGRLAKAQSRNAGIHALEESDPCVVPVKQNEEGQPLEEAVEGKRRPRRTTHNPAFNRHRAGNGCPRMEQHAPSGAGEEARAVHGFAS